MKKTILLLAALVLTNHSVQAANGTWTGATDGNWNINGNWTGASFPGAGNTAFFNSDVTNSTISMNGAAIGVGKITFETDAESYTFNPGGGSLALGTIELLSSLTGAVTQTFNVATDVTGAPNVFLSNNSTSGILDLAGGLTSSRATTSQIYVDGSGNVTINGLTSTGAGGLTVQKSNSGKLTLAGPSSTSGGTNLSGGILQLNSTGALGSGNFTFRGGIIGLGAGDFTMGLGAGANQLRWTTPTGDTGFAAYGADRNVNLGGAGATLAWGGFQFITTTQSLVLGSADSTHKLTFQNGLNLADGARTIVVNDGTSTTNVDGEISGVISSTDAASGSLIKTGLGTLDLSNDNTYTGLTTVSAGTLLINGSIAGGASVASGAALGGAGTIAGTTTIDGSLRPGNSIGTLAVQDDVTWNGGNAWVFELGGAAASLADANSGLSTQDQLNITGGDFLQGSGTEWVFDFDGTGTTGWYKLVDWTGSSTFDALDFSATNLSGGLSGSFVVDGATSALYLNVVPEPGTWGLVALSGLLLMVFRRRVAC